MQTNYNPGEEEFFAFMYCVTALLEALKESDICCLLSNCLVDFFISH